MKVALIVSVELPIACAKKNMYVIRIAFITTSTIYYNFVLLRNGTLPEVIVDFEVDGISPSMCSPYGGCDVMITGKGLQVKDTKSYSIKLGHAPCNVKETSENEIKCFLGNSSRVHEIKNDAFSDGEYNLIIFVV